MFSSHTLLLSPATGGPSPACLPLSCPGDTPALPGCCSRNVSGKAGSGRPCTPPPPLTSSRQSVSEAARPRLPGSSPRPQGSPGPAPELGLDSAGYQLSHRFWGQSCFLLGYDAQTIRCTAAAGAEEHVYSPPSSQSQAACCCVHDLSEIWAPPAERSLPSTQRPAHE